MYGDKRALVTMVFGEQFERIWSVARSTFEAYARRFDLDIVVIRDRGASQVPQYAKRAIHSLLDTYDRVAFVDADILIRDDAPNLFDVVPEECVGVLEEGRFFRSRYGAMASLLARLGRSDAAWLENRKYYNTGVMVVSRKHAAAFASLYPEVDNYGEQTHLNYQFWLHRYAMFELDHRLNRMAIVGPFTGESRHDCFFLHYAGSPREQIADMMQSDLAEWTHRPARYPRNICLHLADDIGYQIACEPVVRYCVERFSKDDNVVVLTDQPDILGHYKDRIQIRTSGDVAPDATFYVMDTDPDQCFVTKRGAVHRQLGSMTLHPLDCGSLIAIGVQLVGDERRVTLPETKQLPGMDDTVLVHAGRGEPSNTFPVGFWTMVIDEIRSAGLRPLLVGDDAGGESGVVGTFLETLALSRSAIGVVTNDSWIAQLAGSTKTRVGIISIATRPELIMPWGADYEELSSGQIKRSDPLNQIGRRSTNQIDPDERDRLLPSRERMRSFLSGLSRSPVRCATPIAVGVTHVKVML